MPTKPRCPPDRPLPPSASIRSRPLGWPAIMGQARALGALQQVFVRDIAKPHYEVLTQGPVHEAVFLRQISDVGAQNVVGNLRYIEPAKSYGTFLRQIEASEQAQQG